MKTIIVKGKPVSIRGNLFEGIIVSTKTPKTVTIKREIVQYNPKYERYQKKTSKIKAHLPEHISVKEGDVVIIGETRKLSKTKSFIVIKKKEAKKWRL